ncbi:leukotriene A-4 hydrolase-like isoform X2 [Temnothorax longispinosus]|uniref:leukotriene A-4 hydrolase-like isoform X2 n=1 Tax=Temnothorax longispinosus TaxID=300112 RepID=UPI003A9A0F52
MDQPSAGDDIPYSYSNPDLVSVTHTRLELSVDVENHVLEGRAILTVKKKVSKCNELVLDTYNLLITDVTKGYRDTPYKFSTRKLTFTHEENPHDDNFGRKLKITLPNVDSAASSSSKKRKVSSNIYYIQVIYKTSPDSPALYWLRREQTFDDKFLLISNTKLTYARAIFPCQDTPSNRTSFYSKIYVPSGRGLDVMMPGKKIKEDVDDDKVEYTFFHPRNEPMAPYEIYIIIGSQREVISNSNLKCNLWTEQKYSHEATWAIHKIMTMLSNIKESYGFLAEKLVAQQEVDYDLIRDEVRNANDFVKIEFLTYLLALPAVPRPKLQLLGCAFLDDQKICEIRFLWLRLCIKSRDLNYVTEALKFASEYCMPKYACSIFRDLHEFEQARSLARSWFIDPDNRSKMLPKTIKELESILDVDLSKPEFRVGTT